MKNPMVFVIKSDICSERGRLNRWGFECLQAEIQYERKQCFCFLGKKTSEGVERKRYILKHLAKFVRHFERQFREYKEERTFSNGKKGGMITLF